MAVIFDLFLFNKKYVEQVREKEELEDHHRDAGVELEVGAVSCRNTDRKQPIFFYDADDLAELLEAGYAIGKGREANEQLVGLDAFPPESVVPFRIELDKPIAGRFVDPDGQETAFGTRKELKAVVTEQLPERQESST